MKTRPPKKNSKLLADLVDCIQRGRTISDACRICGISTTTFNRWREKDLHFNKDIILATQNQWKYATSARNYRVYKRKAYISLDYDQNALRKPLEASQSQLKSIEQSAQSDSSCPA